MPDPKKPGPPAEPVRIDAGDVTRARIQNDAAAANASLVERGLVEPANAQPAISRETIPTSTPSDIVLPKRELVPAAARSEVRRELVQTGQLPPTSADVQGSADKFLKESAGATPPPLPKAGATPPPLPKAGATPPPLPRSEATPPPLPNTASSFVSRIGKGIADSVRSSNPEKMVNGVGKISIGRVTGVSAGVLLGGKGLYDAAKLVGLKSTGVDETGVANPKPGLFKVAAEVIGGTAIVLASAKMGRGGAAIG